VNRVEPPFVGHVRADGFLIDVELLGASEARRRVLDAWTTGSSLRRVDLTCWLLTLPGPLDVRCEAAPGLPLERAGGLVPAGSRQNAAAGVLRTQHGGRWAEQTISDLPTIDPGRWIDLGELTVHQLEPHQRVERPPTPIEPPAKPEVVDMRARAKLAQRSPKADELARELGRTPSRPGGARVRGAGPAAQRKPRGAFARLVLRSPAAPVVRRRHAAYLRSLTEAFERKRFDDALRDAIAITGAAGFTSLRLPSRRRSIAGPTTTPGSGGASLPWGPTVHEHLSNLYRTAAEQLEQQGRVEEAAFVLNDLLGNVLGAVGLLERHRRFALAAELADGRNLAADLVVRLRWRAGHRQRALEVARSRGAYAAAIARLERLDPAQARQLRAAWARALSQGGDHLAAVEAAWPVVELRPTVVADIQAGMALGGPTAARLFAYLLALQANQHSRDGALALLASPDPLLTRARDSFLDTLSVLRCSDPAIDRELATAALRVVIGHDGAPVWDEQATRRAVNAFKGRADPVLRADLPAMAWHVSPKSSAPQLLSLDAPEAAGQLPVCDVAALPGGALLVAHGNHGVRLLSHDGRTRARWDIPTRQLVLADHGGCALLANFLGDQVWELHTLNLSTRHVTPWLTIRVNHLERTFDGVTLTVVDEHGTINFLDASSDRTKILWRELNDVATAVDLSRSPGHLCAVVRTFATAVQPTGRLEQWQWELPTLTLRRRTMLRVPTSQAAITSMGVFLRLGRADPDADSGAVLLAASEHGRSHPTQHIDTTGTVALMTSGTAHALIHTFDDMVRVDLSPRSPGPCSVSVRFPGQAQPQFRAAGDRAAIWDPSGRIVVVDTSSHRAVCSLRTRL